MANRWHRHLLYGRAALRRALPAAALGEIEAELRAQEASHHGELRVAVEASLPLRALVRRLSPRERALELFAKLGVGATRTRSGVLVYLLLAERALEIVADRGIAERIPQAEWERICAAMRVRLGEGAFTAGVVEGLRAIGALLAQHYPALSGHPNQRPDGPVVP